MRLYAALLQGGNDAPNSQNLRGLGKAIAQMIRLTRALEAARDLVQNHRLKESVHSYQCVFVAPEYFFSNQRAQSNRFFKHEVKQWILAALGTLAGLYSEFLIIPGTVLWTKKARRGDLTDSPRINRVKDRINQADSFNQDRKPKLFANYKDSYGSQVYGIVDAMRKKTGYAHAGTFGSTPGNNTDSNDQNFDMPMHYLDNVTDTLVAQNVAYVCKGERILKYHKVGNVTEVDHEAKNLVFAPGSIRGRFKVGGVTYGLEICMDHWLGVLIDGPPVDIHIITSSYTENRSFHYAIKSGGLVLHSSTERMTNIIPAATVTASSGMPKLVESISGPDGLTVLVLDLDDGKLGLGSCSPQDVLEPTQPQSTAIIDAPLQDVKHVHHQLFDAPLFGEMVGTTGNDY
ncbi:MAG TPA: hypothetical protein PKD86_01350 [Gemmatales bacterium]|nr:hypothetical protein [Gemmatales bacterium]HMP57971.1 hypothetical protein [Gemmatales bacterium]